MAKVGVRIEGKETLSPAADSASKSLRALREETEHLKKSTQGLLQPLINIRSTIMSVGGAAGVIQTVRAVSREIGASIKAYADTNAEFKGQLDNVKSMGQELRVLIGEKLSPVVSGLATAFGRVADRILDAANNAKLAAEQIQRLKTGADFGERVTASLGPNAAYNAMPRDAFLQLFNQAADLAGYLSGGMGLFKTDKGDMVQRLATWKEMAAMFAEVEKVVKEWGLQVTDIGQALEQWRKQLWAAPPDLAGRQGAFMGAEGDTYALARSWGDEFREQMQAAFDASEGDVYELAESFGTELRAQLQAAFDQSEGDTFGLAPAFGDEERTRLQNAFDANEGDTFAVAPTRGQQNVDAFGAALQEAVGGLGGFVGGLMNSVATMGPMGLLFEALKPVLAGILEVLGPAIEGVLAPLFGALVVIGKLIGTLLAPVFQILALVLDPVIELFVGAYNFLLPVFNLLGKGLGYLAVGVDAVSRPFEWLGDLVTWVGAKLAYWIDSLPLIGTGKLTNPGTFISDAFERPLIGNGWTDLTPIDTGTLTAEGVDYFEGTGGAFGGGYSGGSSGAGGTTVQQMPDITVNLTIHGSVYGAAGPREVGEEVARALEAYAGIGGRIRIEGALT